jgi:hypothetical protein
MANLNVIETGLARTSEDLIEASKAAFIAERRIQDLQGILSTVPHIEQADVSAKVALKCVRDLAREVDAALKVHIAALEADRLEVGRNGLNPPANGF